MAEIDEKALTALAAFDAEFEGLKTAPEYKELVTGDYLCGFDPIKSRLFVAETGRAGFKICFLVQEGDYIDRRIFLDLWIQADDPKAREMAKRDLLKLGLIPADLRKPPQIQGRFLVTVKADDDGFKVQKFVAIAG